MSRSLGTLRNSFFGLRVRAVVRTATASLCVLLLLHAGAPAFAASYPPVSPQAGPQNTAQPLSRDQLDNLVAPVALYPDELLGEILAASTYPLEIVEAGQWLQQNGNLQGQTLIDAARQQNWDPSVQLLVGFPDVVSLLNRDIQWTTDLGNAFLAQQADVMNAVQTMRFRAKNNGRLTTTPQQVVTTESQNGQYAVQIEPANPQVIYPPVYNPTYVWGPPPIGAYPPVSYYPASAPYSPYGYGGYGGYGGYSGNAGYGFGAGINIAGLFSGLVSFASWGWALGWFTHTLSLASLFFNLLGFHGFGGGGYGGSTMALWTHNPAHRLGVAYPHGFSVPRNAGMAAAARPYDARGSRPMASTSRSNAAPDWQRFNAPAYSARGDMTRLDMARNGLRNAPRTAEPQQHYSEQRVASSRYSEPSYSSAKMSTPHYSAPKFSAPKFSAPKFSAPKFSAPKFSAPKNSGGGHSGKSSHKH